MTIATPIVGYDISAETLLDNIFVAAAAKTVVLARHMGPEGGYGNRIQTLKHLRDWTTSTYGITPNLRSAKDFMDSVLDEVQVLVPSQTEVMSAATQQLQEVYKDIRALRDACKLTGMGGLEDKLDNLTYPLGNAIRVFEDILVNYLPQED